MFGPNTTIHTKIKTNYSHRDTAFKVLFGELRALFINKFKLQNYDILFIPGSGTFAMELLILNYRYKLYFPHSIEGKFLRRWRNMDLTINSMPMESPDWHTFIDCQFETSISKYNETLHEEENAIVDAVCSFPYYPIPNKSIAFVTVPNKLLGSLPGLAIVGIRKDCWDRFKLPFGCFSTLDLKLYKEYADKGMTPTTPPVQIFQHLIEMLNIISIDELRKEVEFKSKLIGLLDWPLVGEKIAPALTIPKMIVTRKDLVRKYQLYGLDSSTQNYQIFTYSEPALNYLNFVCDFSGVD